MESEREWRMRGEHTKRTQLMEQYMRKVPAVSACGVLICWIDDGFLLMTSHEGKGGSGLESLQQDGGR